MTLIMVTILINATVLFKDLFTSLKLNLRLPLFDASGSKGGFIRILESRHKGKTRNKVYAVIFWFILRIKTKFSFNQFFYDALVSIQCIGSVVLLTKSHVSQRVFPLPQMTKQIDAQGNSSLCF